MTLKKLMLDSCKMIEKYFEVFHTFLWHFFPSLKLNSIVYRSSKVSSGLDCIFEIHLVWQPGFSRVYFNCFCSCSFEPEIIKIGQSSSKMNSDNILNFEESKTILIACTTKVWKLIEATTCIYIYVFACVSEWICIQSEHMHDTNSSLLHPGWFPRNISRLH